VKAVILAGGAGTRLAEYTDLIPKPMVVIGGKPILWHIMKIYSAHGVNEFIICLGHKGYVIKEYFANYFLHMSDVTFDLSQNKREVHQIKAEPWKVTLVETGENTMTGGRLKRVKNYIGNEDFCFTYGDGVGNVDIAGLLNFHRKQGTLATVTATNPPGRFGTITHKENKVVKFSEKPHDKQGWINGGFFILSPRVFSEISGDDSIWEQEPMENLVCAGQMSVYFHKGFWQPMDTLRDKNYLEKLWNTGNAPWKIW
tara:strand:- start:1006 stop:1773 length:768 start_codon:yes stop_codon:yes gene_type:complete